MPVDTGMRIATPVVLLSVLLACGTSTALPPDLFPATAAGVWRRTSLREMGASEAPDPVPRNEIERIAAASYEGPGKIEARVYALRSPAVGLELAQRWRPSADTVFFNSGPYFVVLKWQAAERAALQSFIHDLEKKLARRLSRSVSEPRT